MLVGGLGCVPVAAAAAAGWSPAHQLVSPRIRTFSPELAVNGAGLVVAAWFSGPGPPVTADVAVVATPAAWTGQKIVVSLGSVAHGLGKPMLLARDGTDVQGEIKVAVSGSGIAYVAWPRADYSGLMIATGDAGKMTKPRVLELPRGAQLQRLAHGLTGPVDAFYLRSGRYYCARLAKAGTVGAITTARHPFNADPCHLPATNGINGAMPGRLDQPAGFQLAQEVMKSKSDSHGNTLAVWDDWPTSGPAWTYGLFYATKVSPPQR